MKFCPNCGTQMEDNAAFCPQCGAQPNAAPNTTYAPVDPYDHTAEFDPQDISDHKAYAMLVYLMGTIGIIIALLAAQNSRFVAFHVRQALKIVAVNLLMMIATAVLFWTLIVPIAAGVMAVVLWVIKIICFFQICSGKAKEPAIIRSLGFMK